MKSTLYKWLRRVYFVCLPTGLQAYLSKIWFKPKFGEHMVITRGRKYYYGNVKFGRGVRIAGSSIFSNLEVGNYTVFAEHFRMYTGSHDYTAFSINDFFPERIRGKNSLDGEHEPNQIIGERTYIGGDVWIGEYVTMKPGITVGDGAIIAGGSLVTKDVEPFSIVGGVPAKFIKWRFDEETREFLQQLKWWEWPEDLIKKNYIRLCRFDRSLLEDLRELRLGN
jgi:acetyltransferase-like isoleucine patch superfamily enzyme